MTALDDVLAVLALSVRLRVGFLRMGFALVPMAVAGVGERGSGDGQRGGAGNENKLVHLMFLMPLEWVGAG
jgi:hypothetical protein